MSTFNLKTSSPFGFSQISNTANIIWVADLFLDDYVGGAELTTEALIDASPFEVAKVHARDVSLDLLQDHHNKFWIFSNISSLDVNLIPTIVANMKYSFVEYDYKFCKYRSIEKHAEIEKEECNCHQEMHGKLMSAFVHGAKSTWWMSEKQFETYTARFPFLYKPNATILSSVFDDKFFANIKLLRQKYENTERSGWLIVGSTSWIKGTDDAIKWCEDKNLDYEVIWNLEYNNVLEKMAQAEGFVFLPRGGDTCPRTVIEAKLLGCQLHLNENVQHASELWFNSDDVLDTESYLYMSRQRFWNGIKNDMEYAPKISGYTTTLNCISQDYPFVESITSMLGFCDEVIVVDGGSNDGTWEKLVKLSESEDRITVQQNVIDLSAKRFAVYDGSQKALARSLCSGDICWQQDSDEIVHESDYQKIRDLARDFPTGIELLSLPVVEYWGGPLKVRMDIFPWKWRMSRNSPNITHGIPTHLRRYDDDGELYSYPGSDGCDYVRKDTGEIVPNASFYTSDVDQIRRSGLVNPDYRRQYELWFKMMTDSLPVVHHYSWFNISRKIRTYRDYWSKHWQSLYNIIQEDTSENNMFFDKPWSEVSDDEIESLSIRLGMEIGGWIFHKKLDFSQRTPYIESNFSHPSVIKSWLIKNTFSISDDDRQKIERKVNYLLDIKGNDNWDSVRKEEGNYDICLREYSFGTRKTFVPKHDVNVDLQQSRGISLEVGDSLDEFLTRAVGDLNTLKESDLVRIDELERFIQKSSGAFCELGFRLPKLSRYYSSRGYLAAGYDISYISLLVGKALGYDVHHFDFNHPEQNKLDLEGYDIVVSYHMLEHVSDPVPAVCKIYDSMKVGAIFHVEVPIEVNGPYLQYAHLFPFHPGDLQNMLSDVGFEILNVSTTTHFDGPQIERIVARKK